MHLLFPATALTLLLLSRRLWRLHLLVFSPESNSRQRNKHPWMSRVFIPCGEFVNFCQYRQLWEIRQFHMVLHSSKMAQACPTVGKQFKYPARTITCGTSGVAMELSSFACTTSAGAFLGLLSSSTENETAEVGAIQRKLCSYGYKNRSARPSNLGKIVEREGHTFNSFTRSSLRAPDERPQILIVVNSREHASHLSSANASSQIDDF